MGRHKGSVNKPKDITDPLYRSECPAFDGAWNESWKEDAEDCLECEKAHVDEYNECKRRCQVAEKEFLASRGTAPVVENEEPEPEPDEDADVPKEEEPKSEETIEIEDTVEPVELPESVKVGDQPSADWHNKVLQILEGLVRNDDRLVEVLGSIIEKKLQSAVTKALSNIDNIDINVGSIGKVERIHIKWKK